MILHTRGQASGFHGNVVGRITLDPISDRSKRQDYIFAATEIEALDVAGYAGLLTDQPLSAEMLHALKGCVPTVHSVGRFEALETGQVVLISGQTGFVRILFRPGSRFNYILVTEQCNSRCLMCSQPPRDIDDSGRIREHLRLIELIDPNVEFLGITGGEPTLLKDSLLELIGKCRHHIPATHIHMLTNGRLFYYESFARRLAEVGHSKLTLGIPLYSDIDREHDFVVQAKGAFDQTVAGLFNLARYQQNVEIRVVIHALTFKRLPALAVYLYRNFPFASHIALMGLEITGYTKPNLDALWVDPFDYQDELEEAVNILANRSMNVSIYNHQLCVLRKSLWPFARHAISDWKNIYIDECHECAIREKCGGFFASALRVHSAHIRSFQVNEVSDDVIGT